MNHKSTAFICIVAALLIGAVLAIPDTEAEGTDSWSAVIEQTDGKTIGDDITFTIYLQKNGVRISDDDPAYDTASFLWSFQRFEILQPIDGGTGRTMTIPSMISYPVNKTIACEYEVDSQSGIAKCEKIELNNPSEPVVVILDKTLGDGDSAYVGGGYATFKDHVLTLSNVRLDLGSSQWGAFKTVAISVEDMDDITIRFEGNNTILSEVPNDASRPSFKYTHGSAIQINDGFENSGDVKITGPGSLNIVSGQFGIVVNDGPSDSMTTISGLRLHIDITCSEFSFLYTGAIVTDGDLGITDSEITGSTSNRMFISSGDSRKRADHGFLNIMDSRVDIRNNDHVTKGEGEVACLSAMSYISILNSDIRAECTSVTGSKQSSIIGIRELDREMCGIIFIDSKVTVIDSSDNVHSIRGLGPRVAEIDMVSSDVHVETHGSSTFAVDCNNLLLVDSKLKIVRDVAGIKTHTFVLYAEENVTVDGSVLDVVLMNTLPQETGIAILCGTITVDNPDKGFVRVTSDSPQTVAVACNLGTKNMLEYDPDYVPVLMDLGDLGPRYRISTGNLDISVTYDYEILYDVSGEYPVPALSFTLGNPSGEIYNVFLLILVVIVALFAIGVIYIKEKKGN